MSSAILGMGRAQMGRSRFGFGSVATTAPRTTSLLRKSDGTQGDCVKIDPRSGDYSLDLQYGEREGDDSVNQRVYLAIRGAGVLPSGGTLTDDVQARVRASVASALRPLTRAGLVVLVDVIFQRPGPSALGIEVRWQKTTTGQILSTFV